MSKLEDIYTLVRLLKEYEFPVSPILEYAINEKIEQLSSNDENPIVKPTIEVLERKDELSVKPIIRSKKGPSVLRIVRPDGTKIGLSTSIPPDLISFWEITAGLCGKSMVQTAW